MENENSLPSERAWEIYLKASEFYSPQERESYLKSKCGDDLALREAVESLLKKQTDSGQIEQLMQRMYPSQLQGEKTGDLIGRYELLELIGAGGCGIVYLAKQQEPLPRKVALKVIRPEMNTQEVLQRFDEERKLLANLQHSNIAKVYDAGATEAGQPYFVMEYIDGERITDYCNNERLTIRQRLELFEKVCYAVQYAHSQGIIHRDIKPSNILVIEESGMPVPKVIDFGIAKAMISRPVTDQPLVAAKELYMGTPAYMSPEQAGLGGLEVDQRTDIYSLGVLLYELLVGFLPFAGTDVTLSELRQKIRENVPQSPTARIAELGQKKRFNIAHCRQIESSDLEEMLNGTLDYIVMSCLKKNREQRYETAYDLAAAIQRYLTRRQTLSENRSEFTADWLRTSSLQTIRQALISKYSSSPNDPEKDPNWPLSEDCFNVIADKLAHEKTEDFLYFFSIYRSFVPAELEAPNQRLLKMLFMKSDFEKALLTNLYKWLLERSGGMIFINIGRFLEAIVPYWEEVVNPAVKSYGNYPVSAPDPEGDLDKTISRALRSIPEGQFNDEDVDFHKIVEVVFGYPGHRLWAFATLETILHIIIRKDFAFLNRMANSASPDNERFAGELVQCFNSADKANHFEPSVMNDWKQVVDFLVKKQLLPPRNKDS